MKRGCKCESTHELLWHRFINRISMRYLHNPITAQEVVDDFDAMDHEYADVLSLLTGETKVSVIALAVSHCNVATPREEIERLIEAGEAWVSLPELPKAMSA